ncbi:hypothetical protein M9H77_17689 [Catharanthus roseus]|uniref:Uncharacterized protein n=1 Tax=Catharanthus roseus TaxID=4058 RepID=A0ACC0B5C7_CATRO|nr:hypothetical protein M9H77_17689 [Catharanthus roseus]
MKKTKGKKGQFHLQVDLSIFIDRVLDENTHVISYYDEPSPDSSIPMKNATVQLPAATTANARMYHSINKKWRKKDRVWKIGQELCKAVYDFRDSGMLFIPRWLSCAFLGVGKRRIFAIDRQGDSNSLSTLSSIYQKIAIRNRESISKNGLTVGIMISIAISYSLETEPRGLTLLLGTTRDEIKLLPVFQTLSSKALIILSGPGLTLPSGSFIKERVPEKHDAVRLQSLWCQPTCLSSLLGTISSCRRVSNLGRQYYELMRSKGVLFRESNRVTYYQNRLKISQKLQLR